MPIYNFNARNEALSTMDSIPDPRSAVEQSFSPLAIFNHQKPDIAYAERMAAELINLAGAWVTVFQKELKSDEEQTEIWDEDADPMYRNGSDLKAYVKPETVAWELTRFGIDNPLKLTVVFHRATIIDVLGDRLLAPGDVIRVPYNAAKSLLSSPQRPWYFRILNTFDSGNFWYRWLYYSAVTELITGDFALQVRHE